MMRRRIASILLCTLLFSGPAFAAQVSEPRETVIPLEGLEEGVLMVRYNANHGYVIRVDPKRFGPLEADEGGGVDVLVPTDADAESGISFAVTVHGEADPDYAADMEAAIPGTLAENGYAVTAYDASEIDLPYVLSIHHGQREDDKTEVYFLKAGDQYFTVTIDYPMEAAEGYGARMREMLLTFEPADIVGNQV